MTAGDVRGLYRSLESWTCDRKSRLNHVRHDNRIRRMVEDNARLRNDMMLKSLGARDYRPAYPNERVKEMIERDGEVEDELHEMQLALDALDHAIDEVRTQIQRERGIDAAHEQARHLSAVDTRLEKRRAHALLALNQTDTKVRELRSQSDQTSRETAFLAGLHAQLAKDRKARWAAIGEVLRRALTIVDARALSRATLVAAQGELQRDFEQFERHWIVLCDVIESERLQRQMFARYSDFYAAKVEGQLSREVRPRNYLVAGVACTDLSKSNPSVLKGEQAMRRKIARARWTRAALMAGVRTTQVHLTQLSRTLEEMCAALRDLPLDDVVDYFEIANARNYANFATMNDLRQHIGELSDDQTRSTMRPTTPDGVEFQSAAITAANHRFDALPYAVQRTEDMIRALNATAADLAQEFQALRGPVEATLSQLAPDQRELHESADFLDLCRLLEQSAFELLDHTYNVNSEEPPPVNLETAEQTATSIRIDAPTVVVSGRDSSDDELDVRSVQSRDVRSAPPIRRWPSTRMMKPSIL